MCSGDAIGDTGAPSAAAAAAAGHSQTPPPPLHHPPLPSTHPAAPFLGGGNPESSHLWDGGGAVTGRARDADKLVPGQVFRNMSLPSSLL
jgi:hypothetical protein